ncbi:alcohol dehydrogenase-like [Rhagoletis pomonella]|uniref:alcohol dehydrogenase-like n=1 Tax=Rhagoletis pomonella TaxID=28610 RepID=UPI001783C136|nr:alcohol dehydrogenase-like [Rhagoletis pomonella]
MELNGKNVICAGGFGGIGLACVKEFLAKGVKNLVIFDLTENKQALLELQNSHPASTIHFIQFDVSKKESITAAFTDAVEKMQYFDVLINGFAIMMDEHIELTVEINLLGVIHSTLTALPYMDKSAGGRGGIIMNVSSVAGLEATALFAIYSATKHGVTAFTRCMADQIYFDHFGVRFITICPGMTDTGLIINLHKRVTFEFTQDATKIFYDAKNQSAETCAKNMITVIETGKNGGVYLLDLGDIKEITYPEFWRPTF